MPDEELTLILRLRDEATKQMKSARAGIVAAGAAIAAAGFTAGKKWDDATKTIVDGTGATGDALKGLQADYQAVAKYGDGAATVIADLNTHLGLEGDALRMVAEAALKAKVDTNLFGDVASQLGLDAEGAAEFLDQLTVAAQGSGVDIDTLTRTIGKSGARWQAAGGDMDDLTATVINAADEFGPSGLRGAMSEILQEVDKGLIPSVASLETQLGDTTGAVERTYEASKTWRDTLRETKDAALAYIGPAGDMLGVLGSTASGLALAGPQMLTWIKGLKLATLAQKAFNLAMKLNPIGLVVTALVLAGLAIWKFRDEIKDGFGQVVQFAQDLYTGVKTWLTDKLGAIFDGVKAKVDAVTGFFGSMKDKIVGNSIVPDMVNGVLGEFDRMGSGMATKGKSATSGFITSMGDTFAEAFAGGGGFMGGIQANLTKGWSSMFLKEGEEQATGFLGTMQGVMGKLGGIPLVGPLLAAFGPALIGGLGKLAGKIGGWIKGLFGGPDEAELAARATFAGFHTGVLDTLGGTQRFADEVQRAINDGWGRTLAETRAGFILMGTDMGKTYDEAFADYERYQNAVGEGNTDLMKQIEDEYSDWSSASADTASEVVHDAAEIGRQFKGLTVEESKKLGDALIGLGSKANKSFTDIHDSAIAAGNALANAFLPHILSVSRAISNIPRNVTIRMDTIKTTSEAIPKRQHGGPVSAGRPYLVGEAGPEVFMPSSSGSVAANKSLPTAEEIGAAVAAALHRVPLVVPQDAVTDSILRRTPNRQALRGWA